MEACQAVVLRVVQTEREHPLAIGKFPQAEL
jgi:hypothetical protein